MKKFYHNLDKLSKKAFDSNGIRNNNLQWTKMKSMLDKEMPPKKIKRVIIFFWFSIIAFTSVVYFFMHNKDTRYAVSISRIKNKALQSQGENSKNKKTSINMKLDFATLSKQIPITNLTNNELSSKHKKNKSDNQNTAAVLQNQPIIANVHTKRYEQDTAFNNQKQLVTIDAYNRIESDTLTNIIVAEKDNKRLQFQKVDSISKPNKPNNPNKIEQNSQSKWNIVTTVAPDFLFVNINSFLKPGFTIGACIEFVPNAHFRLRSGLMYNYNKINIAGVDYDFKAPNNLPSYTTLTLQNVLGNLHVLEIPLSIRYTRNIKHRIKLNLSAGMSSFFFLNKDYSYRLLLDNTTIYNTKQNDDPDDNGSPHILNNLILSAGIGFKLKNGKYIEIEPTLKLPLEELNEGHKNVGSLAIYFNLKLPLKKIEKRQP